MNATSIRVDHIVSDKLTVFGRYNYSPSETVQRTAGGFFSLNNLNRYAVKTQTLTAGTTLTISPNINNDFRANYSRNRGISNFSLDSFGGAVVPADSVLFPAGRSSQDSALNLNVGSGLNSAFFVGKGLDNLQRQVNLIDNLSVITGSHQLKFGIDYRRLSPIFFPRNYQLVANFSSVNAATMGLASSISITQQAGPQIGLFTNLSVYSQDTWRATRRLTITYGLRWEYNPPPSEANGNDPFTVTGVDDPATLAVAPIGTSLYKTTYNNFAPRIGVAYQLSQRQGKETVLRGGFGVFYDLGNGQAGNALTGPPFIGRARFTNQPFPPTQAIAVTPPLNTTPPFLQLYGIDPNLKLPYTYQWNFSVEQSLGTNQTVTASYVAAIARRLVRLEQFLNPNPTFTDISIARNAATSDYHAMQLQFQRRLSRGLQTLASYTFSKSLDSASNESLPNPPSVRLDPRNDRGPSDFDVRHAFNAAVTYNLPTPDVGAIGRSILGNWALDTIFSVRSATPVNVTVTRDLGFGFFSFRPDLIQGVPLYLDDPTVGGGRRINPQAFSVPTQARQGTLGRNALQGFPLYQIDLALRRRFNLTERVNVQLRAEAFNLFNHPNFGNPTNTNSSVGTFFGQLFANPSFGRSTSLLGRSLGSGGTGGGFNPLYQVGGPRSIQLSFKVQF